MTNKEYYKGNELLKGSGVQVEWTDELIEEYRKCSADVLYFIKTYCKIIHPDRGLIPFIPRDYQIELLEMMKEHRFVAASWGRQLGKSEIVAAFLLHFALFNKAKTIVIASNQRDGAQEVLSRLKTTYTYLPKFLQQGVKRWNEYDISLENLSRIIAVATTSSAGRGKSVSYLYCDEAAWVENFESFWDSIYPTISSGSDTRVVMSSTPQGLNWWYKIVQGARNGTNEFVLSEAKWDRNPERDEKWKEQQIKNSSIEAFNQNHEVQFLGSTYTLIEGWKLQQLVSNPPINDDESLAVFEMPKEDHLYIMTCDVSRGKGIDYHAFNVIDITQRPYVQVARYRNNTVSPVTFAGSIHETAINYNNAFILVELNDTGPLVSETLWEEFEYENLICTQNNGRRGKQVLVGSAGKVDRGLITTKQTKAIGCAHLKSLVHNDQLIVNDLETIVEFSTFEKKNKSYEAQKGCHDDITMSLVLFAWLSDQQWFKEMTDMRTREHIRELTKHMVDEQMLPLGFRVTGLEEEVLDDEEDVFEPESKDFWFKDGKTNEFDQDEPPIKLW